MSNRDITKRHTLFVAVEYDPQYTGGDYSGVGNKVLLPIALIEAVGTAGAFRRVTGLSARCIVHHSESELVNGAGEVVEFVEEFPDI